MASISGFSSQATITASISLNGLGASHVMDHLAQLQSASYLGALLGGFNQLNHTYGMRGLAQAYESGFMAGAMSVGAPSAARCPCGHLYGQSRNIDLANTTLNRLGAMRFEEYLKRRPDARAEVEMRLGGRIHFGATDGVIKVTPFAPGTARALRLGADSPTLRVMELFGNMDRAAMSCGLASGASGGNPFMSFLAAGMAQVASGALRGVSGSGGSYGGYGGYSGAGASGNGGSYGFNDRGGDGEGPYQSRMGMGPMGDEADAILNDPSLEMTDKILLFLMAVVKKIDDDLEKQMKKVNDLQQQANKDVGGKSAGGGKGGKGGGGVSGAQGGKGGKGGGGADGKKESSPSVDMETMKLKRMVDKRSNIFDALRSIIDRIQQLAKAVSDFSR